MLGALLIAPLGFLRFADEPLLARLVMAALVGAGAGATLGFVLGGSLRSKGSSTRLAAERGVVVSIDLPDRAEAERVAAVLEDRQPVRVDSLLPDGQPADTLTTEEER